jgi:hypothetical protein
LVRKRLGHLARGSPLRTDETTSRTDRVVAAASRCSAISDAWVAPAMTRCTLLVDNVARWFCAAVSAASCPLPAVRTTSGLPAKSVKAAACPAADDWRYSSIVLRRLPAVAILALTSSRDRGGRPLAANRRNSHAQGHGREPCVPARSLTKRAHRLARVRVDRGR